MIGALCGCTSEEKASERFVVEGFVYAGEEVTNVKIKGLNALDPADTVDKIIDNAQVTLSWLGDPYQLIYSAETGKYEDPTRVLQAQPGDMVSISAIVGGREATSSTVVPDPPTGVALSASDMAIPRLILNPNLRDQIVQLFAEVRINLSWENPLGESFYVVIEPRVDSVDAILPREIPREAKDLLGSFRFITEPSDETSFEIIGVALQSYGLHVAKVYKVNPEYEDLFNNLEQDSRDLNEPPTNIIGGLGIFTAFASDSVFFNVVPIE